LPGGLRGQSLRGSRPLVFAFRCYKDYDDVSFNGGNYG